MKLFSIIEPRQSTPIISRMTKSMDTRHEERVTVLCCVSTNAFINLKERFINYAKKPRRLVGVKKIPMQYCSNSIAWTTSIIWNEYLTECDRPLIEKFCFWRIIALRRSICHLRVVILACEYNNFAHQRCDLQENY